MEPFELSGQLDLAAAAYPIELAADALTAAHHQVV
jgi:hypothetical protein